MRLGWYMYRFLKVEKAEGFALGTQVTPQMMVPLFSEIVLNSDSHIRLFRLIKAR
jgi:hypothetical protein